MVALLRTLSACYLATAQAAAGNTPSMSTINTPLSITVATHTLNYYTNTSSQHNHQQILSLTLSTHLTGDDLAPGLVLSVLSTASAMQHHRHPLDYHHRPYRHQHHPRSHRYQETKASSVMRPLRRTIQLHLLTAMLITLRGMAQVTTTTALLNTLHFLFYFLFSRSTTSPRSTCQYPPIYLPTIYCTYYLPLRRTLSVWRGEMYLFHPREGGHLP